MVLRDSESTSSSSTGGINSGSSGNDGIAKPIESDSETDSVLREEMIGGSSKLFAPYRSLGIVSGDAPFDVIPNDHSGNALICVPIGNRFQIMRADHLQPVMVSQAVSGKITNCLTDASMSITVASHSNRLSLFRRSKPIHTRKIAACGWVINMLVRIGKVKLPGVGEKEGQSENALAFVVLLSKGEMEQNDVPPVNPNDSEDEDSDDDHDDEGSVSESHKGEVQLLIATRSRIILRKTIRLNDAMPYLAVHPATYLNKILVASRNSDGEHSMSLLNVVTGKIVHNFDCLVRSEKPTCFEQSPALDTVAVGTAKGNIYLVNLKFDKKLFHFSSGTNHSPVNSIAFRTDNTALKYGLAPMTAGLEDGSIISYNLAEDADVGRGILSEIRRAHVGGVKKLYYFPQEPLLLSSGADSNSIQIHVFDDASHQGRLLKQRSGHRNPPTCVRFLHGFDAGGVLANAVDGTDARGYQLLSGGGNDRSFRVFSVIRSVLDKEYGQGEGLERKARKLGIEKEELLLPPVLGIAVCEAQNDWGDVVTIHRNHSFAYIWSSKKGSQSGPVLRQPGWNISDMKIQPPTNTNATCLSMSACGNFVVVGTRNGTLFRYNVQSGRPTGCYPSTSSPASENHRRKERAGDIDRTSKNLSGKGGKFVRPANQDVAERTRSQEERSKLALKQKLKYASHVGAAAVGVAIDSVNKYLFSVGSDSKLIVWNFRTHSPHRNSPLLLPCPATKLAFVRDSQLAAVALDDFSCLIFDAVAHSIVRRFGVGETVHTGPINDLSFSADGRSLFTASNDGTIRVWDIPTSSCVDYLGFESAPTSLTVSATGEFIATTHSGQRGISVWVDLSFYQPVDTGEAPKKPYLMNKPSLIVGQDLSDMQPSVVETSGPQFRPDRGSSKGVADDVTHTDIVTPKDRDLLTLSAKALSHWKTVFHLDLVKERNKPSEAPKKPESAPFFLQWRPSELVTTSEKKLGSTNDEMVSEWAGNWTDDDSQGGSERKRKAPPQVAVNTKKRLIPAGPSRSRLAILLVESNGSFDLETMRYMLSLGPSRIDIELLSLCSGPQDFEEGVPMLNLASRWLCEVCRTRAHYDAMVALVRRFLYLHSENIVEAAKIMVHEDVVEEMISNLEKLKDFQKEAILEGRRKMKESVAIVKHLTRMI